MKLIKLNSAKRKLVINSLLLAATVTFLHSCYQSNSKEASKISPDPLKPTAYTQEQVIRGEYMVTVMGCNDCHSPKKFGPMGPEPDPELLLSGHPQDMPLPKIDTTLIGAWIYFNAHSTATVGPWGVSFASNLTSDATGIGNWTEEQFFRALREGKSKGLENNRNILPPMPWPMIAKASDEDIRAIFAYLKTVKPVKNVPPNPMSLKEISIH